MSVPAAAASPELHRRDGQSANRETAAQALVLEETVAWAERNGCADLVAVLSDEDFYCTGGAANAADVLVSRMRLHPKYAPGDSSPKVRPKKEDLANCMEILLSRWDDVAGPALGMRTRPLAFKGAKRRRLLLLVDEGASPPWGSWFWLPAQGPERRLFTNFRAAVNAAIAPHHVDHIDFKFGSTK